MNTFGERLQFALDSRGMIQNDLAKKLGVTRSSISQICSGSTKRINAEHALEISKLLNVNPFWLVLGEGSMELSQNSLMSPDAVAAASLVNTLPAKEQKLSIKIIAQIRECSEQ
jgi:transcriptional regulator with XRE-family HTH domain